MIASGEKTEEYREIKPYWTIRFADNTFDEIKFRNGYAADAPTVTVELRDISLRIGKPELGAPVGLVYTLKLGRILDRAFPQKTKKEKV